MISGNLILKTVKKKTEVNIKSTQQKENANRLWAAYNKEKYGEKETDKK